jgi:hypothetical protein
MFLNSDGTLINVLKALASIISGMYSPCSLSIKYYAEMLYISNKEAVPSVMRQNQDQRQD